MEINELRIGNYVKHYDPINGTNIYKVYRINDSGSVSLNDKGQLASCTVEDIQPIELTDELLVKIGFEIQGRYRKFTSYELVIRLSDSIVRIVYIVYNDGNPTIEIITFNEHNEYRNKDIKYLHQLQNVYYCLTGQELEIEL